MQRQFHFIPLSIIVVVFCLFTVGSMDLVLEWKLLWSIHVTAFGMVETIMWAYRYHFTWLKRNGRRGMFAMHLVSKLRVHRRRWCGR
jgi:hypothetical protein